MTRVPSPQQQRQSKLVKFSTRIALYHWIVCSYWARIVHCTNGRTWTYNLIKVINIHPLPFNPSLYPSPTNSLSPPRSTPRRHEGIGRNVDGFGPLGIHVQLKTTVKSTNDFTDSDLIQLDPSIVYTGIRI